jgi:hypothetical protein
MKAYRYLVQVRPGELTRAQPSPAAPPDPASRGRQHHGVMAAPVRRLVCLRPRNVAALLGGSRQGRQ